MHSGLRLKSILEMKSNLTFAILMGYLQHQLNSITQIPDEDSLYFILRCIELWMVRIELSVQLGTVEANAPAEIDKMGIVISLTKGVAWADVEIKSNISVMYCTQSRTIIFYIRLQIRFQRKKKHHRHILLLGWESYHLVGNRIRSSKTYYLPQKRNLAPFCSFCIMTQQISSQCLTAFVTFKLYHNV